MSDNKTITFYKPSKTLSVSLTGSSCQLDCAHCGGHYLSSMTSIDKFIQNIDNYKTHSSILLSGGCSENGRVELETQLPNLELIAKKGFQINFHTGIATPQTVDIIKHLSTLSPKGHKFAVSYDFVTDDETIQQVYGINKTGSDYIESYIMLKNSLNVTPHLCIGLLGGKLQGEFDALNKLSEVGCDKLVLIIFIPTKNTAFKDCPPPDLQDIEKVFATAKRLFNNIPIQLGCMRPIGKYRKEIDLLALKCGINHFVMPSKEVVEACEEMGLKTQYKEECCIL